MWKQHKFPIKEHLDVGEIRRHAQDVSKILGFDETLTGKVSIVVTELATNIVKHATTGEMILIEGDHSLHILALDKGPGMKNFESSLQDGVSTGGTSGNGLGAIKRGSSYYDHFTSEGKGTVIYVRFSTQNDRDCGFGVICTPYPGESVAGDSWEVKKSDEKFSFILADGLGHGLMASEASRLAVSIFAEEDRPQEMMMEILHRALRPTRGAAVSLADIDYQKKTLTFCGVGNVQGSIKSVGSIGKKCVNYNGTVGVQIRKIQSMTYPYESGDIFVLASDGLSTHWDLMDYPGLMGRHPFVIAGILFRDFMKTTDDVTVIVVKENA